LGIELKLLLEGIGEYYRYGKSINNPYPHGIFVKTHRVTLVVDILGG
jgi:hypothetical protein